MRIFKLLLLSFHGMSNPSFLVLPTKYWKAIVNPSLFTCLSTELYLPLNGTRFELETSTSSEGDFIWTSTKNIVISNVTLAL